MLTIAAFKPESLARRWGTIYRTAELPPRLRIVLYVAVAGIALGMDGDGGFEPAVRAETLLQGSTAASAPPQAAGAAAPVSLGFELPPDFWRRDADGSYAVTGFRVGYFPPIGSSPFRMVEVARGAVKVNGTIGQILLEISQLPAGASRVVIRLQTLSGGKASAWSEASPLIGPATAPPRSPRQTAASRRPQSVAAADVERHVRLAEALKKTLPPGARLEDVLAAYRRIDDLAVAVALCRDNKIALTALSQKILGPPRRSLPVAVRELRPDLERRAIRQARVDARQLLDAPAR